MANPAEISDIIKVTATISPGGGISLQSFSDPVFISEFAASVDFPGRIRAYVGTLSEMQASLIADGFAANSPSYRQITSAMVQEGPPDLIYIGRSDVTDLTYTVSLTAIWDAASANNDSLYFACVDERDPAAIEEIADFANQRDFVFYMAATADSSVFDNQPGNVAANIITKGYDTTALVWHAPAVASNFAPASLQSLRGPFVLPSVSGDIKVRIDAGAEQTFTLVANAATVTGSNTGTFVVANGDGFTVTVDNGTLQNVLAVLLPAAVTSSNEFFNVPPGSVLQTSFNGAAATSSTFTGVAGSVTTSDEPYVFLGGDSVTFDIDGTGAQVISFAITDTTRALVITALAPLTGVSVVDTGTGVLITSLTTGSASDVEITAGSANALTELGIIVGNNAGSGFAANFAVATAAELQVKLAADYAAAGTISVVGTAVEIATQKIGKAAAVRVLDGLANDAIGFPTSEVRGDGDFNDGSAVTTNEVVAWISEKFFGLSVSNSANAVKLDTRSRGSASEIDIAASTLGTTFGFAVAVTPSVGSNVNNSASATASEISSVITATPIVDGTSGAANSKFTIDSLVDGPTSTVELTGGTYADTLFGDTTTATGTGTDEDYIDCAYVGRLATLRLDEPSPAGGQSTWDNAPLNGIFPDAIPANTRKVLHETLKVNTYENRLGRNEMHFGTVLFGTNKETFRYIDQRVTLDWGWARSVETFKTTLNNLANNKSKAPNTDDGIQMLATDWKRFLQSGQTNGHWVYDGSDITSATDTGITIPTRAQQTAPNVALRKISGFIARFQFQDAIHRVDAQLNLTSFVEVTLNVA